MGKRAPKQSQGSGTYPLVLKPLPFADARDLALLDFALVALTGFQVHVMQAGERYAVLGSNAFSIVMLNEGKTTCIICKTPCMCADVVTMWRRRMQELGRKL